MNRIILLLVAVAIGLSAKADYTIQTSQPLYPNQIISPQNYNNIQPYQQYQTYQNYNHGYAQNPYYTRYQNPYQVQGQYINPYLYQNQYGYGNNLPATVINSAVAGLGNTNSTPSVMKNIFQSLLYAKMRGY